MITYVYKIKTKDGLYSIGQSRPKFSENGKCWGSLRYLRVHLKTVEKVTPPDHPDYPYHNCSIIRYRIEEDEICEVLK